jgi:hypothetical protein
MDKDSMVIGVVCLSPFSVALTKYEIGKLMKIEVSYGCDSKDWKSIGLC